LLQAAVAVVQLLVGAVEEACYLEILFLLL
jgi:hypothetical protein